MIVLRKIIIISVIEEEVVISLGIKDIEIIIEITENMDLKKKNMKKIIIVKIKIIIKIIGVKMIVGVIIRMIMIMMDGGIVKIKKIMMDGAM